MAMQFVAVLEPDVLINERSELRSDIDSGVTEIPVKNAQGFESSNYLCIGKIGEETTEFSKIVLVDEDARTVTVETATRFAHYDDDNVAQMVYNKRKFYRYDDETETWEHLTSEGSPKDIEVDNPQGTFFEDSEGTEDDTYKATYINVAKSTETSLQDAEAITGGGASTDLISLYRIRRAAGFDDNYYIDDAYLDQYRQDAQGEVWASLRKRYEFPLTKNSSLLRNIVKDLAVGFIWLDQYSGNREKVDLAMTRIKSARERLSKLAEGVYILYDESDKVEQTETGKGGGLSSFPDDNTEDTDDERIFKLNDEY
jgi:phage gp36-like protein